jgi:hypothetical protein
MVKNGTQRTYGWIVHMEATDKWHIFLSFPGRIEISLVALLVVGNRIASL